MYDILWHSKSHPKLFKNNLYVVGNTILSSAVTCTYSNLTSDRTSGKCVDLSSRFEVIFSSSSSELEFSTATSRRANTNTYYHGFCCQLLASAV